ncbi:hypothetical protein PUNSTDRAFT_25455, partial [Punctularia strigosozonata HHB-11173 SS5]|uniref:uncharacterized protein n=1 Tax=Punctularia strigosozonata (strain HHB-11173) TaxID=741275 RepID=UPI000441644B
MGKLNIAHHKSYHPYRRDNIARVKRDEEEARLNEAKEEGRMMLADAEARISLLRERAGLNEKKPKREEEELMKALEGSRRAEIEASTSGLPTSGGHINFFEDLEQQQISAALASASTKHRTPKDKAKEAEKEDEKGVALAPSKKDLNPWYSSKSRDVEKEIDEGRRNRDLARQSAADPLTFINTTLSSRSGSSSSMPTLPPSRPRYNRDKRRPTPPPPPASTRDTPKLPKDSVTERQTRESSERARALALIERKKREMRGSETPSTVHGGYGGYRDVFNREEVEEARR